LIWGGGITAAAAGLLAWQLRVPLLPAYLGGVNVATILLYGYDKLAARSSLLRVPENALHFLALAGGTPGAFLAQGLFHHKTSKGSFRLTFWLLAAIQLALIVWALWYFR